LKSYLPLITLFVLSVVLLFSNIWGQPIYILDEAKNATCAREMLDRGDLIVPTFNDQLRSDKPPLHYHFMMLAYKLFGVNEFAARFFSSFFGMLTVLFTYLFTKRFLNEKVGIAAGVILLSSLYFNLQFHFAVPDPYLIFFIALALGSFFIALEEHRPRLFYLFYIALAMGVLSKGPVAIALPGLILLLYLIFSGQFKINNLKIMRIPTGILLFLGFALPWYVLVGEATDNEWLESFFFKHNVGRFSKTMEGHGGPFFITPLFALLGLLPFSMFAPQALYVTWKKRKSPDRILLFSLIVTAVFVGFFSISQTKLPNYIAPMFPFFAIILAYFITGLDELKMRQYKTSISYRVFFLIALLLPIAAYIAIPTEKSMIGLEYLAFFLVFLPIGGLAALIFHHKRDLLKANLAIALSFMLTSLCVFYVVYPTLYKDNPVSLSLRQIDTSKPIAYYKRFNPSFAFYLKRPIPKFHTKKEVQAFFEKHPEGYLITERKRFKDISDVADFQIITERKDTFERPVTMVLKLKKTTR
jgi:4-amino-4-deoxy-L-arabinose transferase-like glycosyltransferase